MFNYDIYGNHELICTISENDVIHAIKKAESHHLVYEKIHNQLIQENQIELLAINQHVPDDWMSFVYSPKTNKPTYDNHKDEIYQGLVDLETNNGLSRKCLALKKDNYVAYFDGAESNFVITNRDTSFDTDDFQKYTKRFPNHFDTVYSSVIIEILEENLHQHLGKL